MSHAHPATEDDLTLCYYLKPILLPKGRMDVRNHNLAWLLQRGLFGRKVGLSLHRAGNHVERAAASGVSHEELLAALLKPPGFLERFRHKRYQYLALLQAALAEEAKNGCMV
jgi:hypothetical protein